MKNTIKKEHFLKAFGIQDFKSGLNQKVNTRQRDAFIERYLGNNFLSQHITKDYDWYHNEHELHFLQLDLFFDIFDHYYKVPDHPVQELLQALNFTYDQQKEVLPGAFVRIIKRILHQYSEVEHAISRIASGVSDNKVFLNNLGIDSFSNPLIIKKNLKEITVENLRPLRTCHAEGCTCHSIAEKHYIMSCKTFRFFLKKGGSSNKNVLEKLVSDNQSSYSSHQYYSIVSHFMNIYMDSIKYKLDNQV